MPIVMSTTRIELRVAVSRPLSPETEKFLSCLTGSGGRNGASAVINRVVQLLCFVFSPRQPNSTQPGKAEPILLYDRRVVQQLSGTSAREQQDFQLAAAAVIGCVSLRIALAADTQRRRNGPMLS